jgi:hypothetical protein
LKPARPARSPDAPRSRTEEAGEEREGRERGRLASRLAYGVGPAYQRRKERGERMTGGPHVAVKCFQIDFKSVQI